MIMATDTSRVVEPGSVPEKPDKHEKFARLLAEHPEMDATKAYLKVYPKAKAYKKSTAWENASRLRSKVLARITWLHRRAEDKTVLTVLEIKQGCARLFRSLTTTKATDFIRPDGRGIVLPAADDDRGLALGGYHYSRSDSEKGSSEAAGFTMRSPDIALKAADIVNELEHRYDKGAQLNVLNNGVLFVVKAPKGATGTLALGTGIRVEGLKKA